MGSILSAICDDEDEWFEFEKKASLPHGKYKVYSVDSSLCKEGFKEHGLTGEFLIEYVNLKMEINALVDRFNDKKERYSQYLKLKKEFEKS